MSDPAVTHWWRSESYPRDAAIVPGTDEVIRAGSATQVKEIWDARCAELGLTFDNELAVFSDACCRALKPEQREEACSPIGENTPEILKRKYLKRAGDVMRFFGTLVSWWKSEDVVTQEKADKRAEICASCPHNNVPLGACRSCSGNAAAIMTKVFQFVGQRRTAKDDLLETCSLCSCSLKVMCWTPHDALMAHQEGVPEAPPWCWKKTEAL